MEITRIAHDDEKGFDVIAINGHVPVDPEHPYQLGKYSKADPLDSICIHTKKQMLSEYQVCIAYSIHRIVDYDGNQTTEIRFRYSNTGANETPHNHSSMEGTCAFWQGLMATECVDKIAKFLDDTNLRD